MTRRTNARVAGYAFLLYIVVGVTGIVVGSGMSRGEGTAAKLASIASHATRARVGLVLDLVVCFTALTLAVALYGLTRDEDHELAVFALACRAGEALMAAVSMPVSLGLLWIATGTVSAPEREMSLALAAYLMKVQGWIPIIAAMLFSVGSTIFCWLLLRGRMIPIALAWLGVIASVLLVVLLPVQLIGVLRGPVTQLVWIPMAAFEIPLGVWLIMRGVSDPVRREIV